MKKAFFTLLVFVTAFLLNAQKALSPLQTDVGDSFDADRHSSVALVLSAGDASQAGSQPIIVANVLYVKGAAQIEVLDLTGKMLVAVRGSETADLTSLNKGIYLVSAVVNGQTCVTKVVKK